MSYYGDVDWNDLRKRILRLLEKSGPLRTQEICAALGWSHQDRSVRRAIRFLDEEKKIKHKNREHPWEIVKPDQKEAM